MLIHLGYVLNSPSITSKTAEKQETPLVTDHQGGKAF